jgi:dipeptidase D
MKTALDYFEEIMSIPRESGKEDKIANYLVSYAKENNLEYSLGKYNTVFLRKNNNSDKTIILQAHSDMVCVSTNGYDFDNKGIPFYIDGDYYKAKDTSLGADDGIGLAIILAILQEKDNMPNIEVMVTTEEETTMLGASNFDYSKITGNTLISLDGITEADIE